MKRFLPLLFILVLAFTLRIWNLGSLPPGMTWDEAALGYNAYSILKTARDEHGVFLPLVFKSFGDYKPGIYVYLTVPFVAIFGLSEFSTRLPSALFGVLAIWGIYLLVNQLFPQKKKLNLGHLAALLLAISPWHLHFSRGAWEANVFVTVLLFATYFFVRAIKQKKPLWPAVLLATSTFYIYQASKMLTPLVFLVLFVTYWPQFRSRLSKLHRSKLDSSVIVLSLIIVIHLFAANLNGDAGNRLKRLSIFSYRPQFSNETIQTDGNMTTTEFFHGNQDLHLRMFASRFINHFSPEILFYEGPVVADRGHIPRLGSMYMFDSILLIAGLIALMQFPFSKSSKRLLLGLLIVSPIPASLTLAEFSTTRALFLVIPLIILASLGAQYIFKKHRYLGLIFLSIYVLNVVLSLDTYFNHSQEVLGQEFNYGHKQAVQAIKDHPAKRVVFTDVLGQPYIYYLFYSQYDPATYQQNNDFTPSGIDVGSVGRVGNIEFHQFGHDDIKTQKDTLFIGLTNNIQDDFDYTAPYVEYSQEITFPGPKQVPAFRIVKSKP